MSIRVSCIVKAKGNHENPYVAVAYMGWINESTGASGISTRLEIYDWIENGGEAYVIGDAGSKILVELAQTLLGTRYLRTQANGTTADHLLKLPECGQRQ